ncbi:MAG: hypothetical protein IJJ23_00230 [Clostridia bacterium]|nr:hypothetical protein [Clostridia bacterium]
MTKRERVLTLLKGEKPDRLPWFADLAYWYPYALDQGVIGPEYRGDGLFQLHRDLGVGFYLQGYHPFRSHDPASTVEMRREGPVTTTLVHTPTRDLRQVDVELTGKYTSAIKEHLIKDIDDLEAYVAMMERSVTEPDYGEAQRRYQLAGDNGVVLCYLPKSSFMELVALKCGIMTVVDMISDDEERFDACLERLEAATDRQAQVALDSPAEFLMIPENISSEVVGKTYYHTYMERYHRKWFERIRAAGKVSLVHMDGTVQGLLGEVSRAGCRIMEAMTPAPTGDVEVEKLKDIAAPTTVLWGGIPGAYFTDLVTNRDFETYVRRVIDEWVSAPRYVLGVGDQVPPYGRVDRILRVGELVERYGVYR